MISTFLVAFFMHWNCCFKRKEKTANQQCSKPDVHTSGYKGGWMLVDLVRPPVMAVTILEDSEQMYVFGFLLSLQKSLTECQPFQPAYSADVSHPVVKNSPK